MNLAVEKKEIIQWINSLENETILKELKQIKNKHTFEFDENWKKGLSIKEARKASADLIKTFPWKK